MKKLYVIIIILFGLIPEIKSQIITVRDNLHPTEPDFRKISVTGKTFRFEFDTLFYVNKLLLKKYNNLFDTANYYKELATTCFTERLKFNLDTKNEIQNLSDNVDKAFKMVRDSLARNNQRLDNWKAENSKLLSINNQISIELNDAKDQIRKEKWNSTGNKMLFGVGGVIVGIGLGSLIILAAK
jgi:hypothetical protein